VSLYNYQKPAWVCKQEFEFLSLSEVEEMAGNQINPFGMPQNTFLKNIGASSNFLQVQPNASFLATPSYDSVAFNPLGATSYGATSGAKSMSYSPTAAWTGQYSGNMYGEMLGTLQGVSNLGAALASVDATLGAAAMSSAAPQYPAYPYNYAPSSANAAQAQDSSSSGTSDDYGAGADMDPNDPNILTIDNSSLADIEDGEFVLAPGQSLTLKNLTKSGLSRIDANNDGPNKIKIGDSIGEDKAVLSISANSGDTIDLSGNWKVDPKAGVTGNKATLINSEGQKVEICGKGVTVSICGTDIKTMLYEGMRTSTLNELLKGKSAAEIEALIDDDPDAFSSLTKDQQRKIAQAYALAYAKDNIADDYPDAKDTDALTFDQLREEYPKTLEAAKKAASEVDENLANALAVAIDPTSEPAGAEGSSSCVEESKSGAQCSVSDADGSVSDTDTASKSCVTSSDELIQQLQGDRHIQITEDNFDKVDFEKIMALDNSQMIQVIKNMDLANLPVALRDRLAVKLAIYANDKFLDAAGVQRPDKNVESLGYSYVSDNLKLLIEAVKNCDQGELARILEVMWKSGAGLQAAVKAPKNNLIIVDKGMLRILEEQMEKEPTRDLGSFVKLNTQK
jgi:hypothetical protein